MQRPVRGRLESARLRLAPHAVRRPRRRAVGRPRQAPRQVHLELLRVQPESAVSDLPEVWRQEACPLGALPVSPALSRLRPRVAVVSCPVFPGLAPAPAVARPVPLARLSAAAGQQVQPARQLAESEASAQPGLALQPEEPAVQDAAVVPEVVWVAAEVRLQAAELPGAAGAQQQEVPDAEAGPRLAVQGEPVELPSVGLPSAAAWVFRRDPILPWPEP